MQSSVRGREPAAAGRKRHLLASRIVLIPSRRSPLSCFNDRARNLAPYAPSVRARSWMYVRLLLPRNEGL
jgi:hypothetical protein